MIGSLATWLGKNLFVPIIIKVCQQTGWSQYKFYNYSTWLALVFMFWTYHDATAWIVWVFACMTGVLLAYQTFIAGSTPERKPRVGIFWKEMILIIMLVDTAILLLTLSAGTTSHVREFFTENMPWEVFALFGEYARSIDSIPPRKKKEQTSKKLAYAGN